MGNSKKISSSPLFHLDGGPPGKFDAPLNVLEEGLIKLSRQEILVPEFLGNFFTSHVYILLPEGQLETSPIEERTTLVQNPTPFSLKHPDYNSLCFYSHPSRIQLTTEKFPKFKCDFDVVAGDFMVAIEKDIGITVNPYWDINFEWNNKQVAGMIKMIKTRNEVAVNCDTEGGKGGLPGGIGQG